MFYIAIISLLIILIIIGVITREERQLKKEALPEGKLHQIWTGQERRRFKRFDVALDVRYKLLKNGIAYGEANTINISSVGVCLITYERPDKDSLIEIMIEHSPKNILSIFHGQVVWVEEMEIEPDTHKRRFKVGIYIPNSPELNSLIDKVSGG